ncbi:MAG: flagellar type III secretion system pore protein FliP [Pirellulaceae bacterium]|jgi:flagellar biosynthetic protein FliP|nr:flagellar type III secretion system pore protein FliP [Pirellulaceae bacterium]
MSATRHSPSHDGAAAHERRRGGALGLLAAGLVAVGVALGSCTPVAAQERTPDGPARMTDFLGGGPDLWTSPQGLTSALQVMLLLTVLSLAPAVLLMTTSFVRMIVVLGLLRQALGTQQLPPSQVITSLALFLTLLIMTPVWKDVYDDAIAPYTHPRSQMTLEEAWQRGALPIKRFMARQIDAAGNTQDIHIFYRYLPPDTPAPQTFDDVPLQVLLPAYLMSELKIAFLIGFQIYLPFLILDIVVASVTISMGMLMLPPVMISLPLKLILFVLVDGWRLVVGLLLESFGTLY